MDLPKINFGGEECLMEVRLSEDGRIGIQLWCDEGPMARATVNFGETNTSPNQILIKNYSENEGMAKALRKAGLGTFVAYPGDDVPCEGAEDVVIMEITHPAVLELLEKLRESKAQRTRL